MRVECVHACACVCVCVFGCLLISLIVNKNQPRDDLIIDARIRNGHITITTTTATTTTTTTQKENFQIYIV